MKKRRLFYALLAGLAAVGVTAGAVLAQQPGGEDSDGGEAAAHGSVWRNPDHAKLDELRARLASDFGSRWANVDPGELRARYGDRAAHWERQGGFRGLHFGGRWTDVDFDEMKARLGDRFELEDWSSRFAELRGRWGGRR